MDYLRTHPTLGSRLLAELERNPKIIELQNRAFLPVTGLISDYDVSALAEAAWLWPNLTSTAGEFTRIHRGETGVLLNTRLSLMFCQLTNAPWRPCCHATLPEELHSHVISLARRIRAFAVEDIGRGAKTFSLSFWARDKFQRTHDLSQDEIEQAILYGSGGDKNQQREEILFCSRS